MNSVKRAGSKIPDAPEREAPFLPLVKTLHICERRSALKLAKAGALPTPRVCTPPELMGDSSYETEFNP